MSRWRLSLLAETDLQSIWNHIALVRGNRDAADRQLELILDKIDTLASTPLLGQTRDDLRENLRSFSAGTYVILYYPAAGRIGIARILHASRDVDAMARRGEL